MKMFNKEDQKGRIGNLVKRKTLHRLEPVETYFLNKIKKLNMEQDYDVVANELPWFRTYSYTEFAHVFIMYPLSPIVREIQMRDAYDDTSTLDIDYVEYFKNIVLKSNANKYMGKSNLPKIEPKKHLIVPVGGNKFKETVCINKVKYIINKYGKDNVYLKPHPLTEHKLVGELKDLLGEDVVLDRNVDLYKLMVDCKTVHSSHRSESIVYASSLGKEIGCIDVYNKAHEGSFFHIANGIYEAGDSIEERQKWIQRTFNSFKSGVIHPDLDPNWKTRIDNYLKYTMQVREKYKNKYVWNEKGTMEWTR